LALEAVYRERVTGSSVSHPGIWLEEVILLPLSFIIVFVAAYCNKFVILAVLQLYFISPSLPPFVDKLIPICIANQDGNGW